MNIEVNKTNYLGFLPQGLVHLLVLLGCDLQPDTRVPFLPVKRGEKGPRWTRKSHRPDGSAARLAPLTVFSIARMYAGADKSCPEFAGCNFAIVPSFLWAISHGIMRGDRVIEKQKRAGQTSWPAKLADYVLVIFDWDKKAGGLESRERFMQKYPGLIGNTLTVRSGGGGMHDYALVRASELYHFEEGYGQDGARKSRMGHPDYPGLDIILGIHVAVLPGSWTSGQYCIDFASEPLHAEDLPWFPSFMEESYCGGSGVPRPIVHSSASSHFQNLCQIDDTLDKRILAFINQAEPAFAKFDGTRSGWDPTWAMAFALTKDFDLPPDVALRYMQIFNRDKCDPLWDDSDLVGILSKASQSPGERGSFFKNEQPFSRKREGRTFNGKPIFGYCDEFDDLLIANGVDPSDVQITFKNRDKIFCRLNAKRTLEPSPALVPGSASPLSSPSPTAAIIASTMIVIPPPTPLPPPPSPLVIPLRSTSNSPSCEDTRPLAGFCAHCQEILAKPRDSRKLAFLRVVCKRMVCEYCGQLVRRHQFRSAYHHISRLPDAAILHVYLYTTSHGSGGDTSRSEKDPEWQCFRKLFDVRRNRLTGEVRYLGANGDLVPPEQRPQYLRIRRDETHYLVVSTIAVPSHHESFTPAFESGSRATTDRIGAITAVRDYIDDSTFRPETPIGSFYSSTRAAHGIPGWTLIEDEKQKEFERITRVSPSTKADVISAAENVGVPFGPEHLNTKGHYPVGFSSTDEFPADVDMEVFLLQSLDLEDHDRIPADPAYWFKDYLRELLNQVRDGNLTAEQAREQHGYAAGSLPHAWFEERLKKLKPKGSRRPGVWTLDMSRATPRTGRSQASSAAI